MFYLIGWYKEIIYLLELPDLFYVFIYKKIIFFKCHCMSLYQIPKSPCSVEKQFYKNI